MTVGVWTAEAWTAEDASSDVDSPNLDYKRTNNVDIYYENDGCWFYPPFYLRIKFQ